MQEFEVIFSKTLPLSDLSKVAHEVAHSLLAQESERKGPFCLWLKGGLGAGKTTFTAALLRAFGLPPNIPVTSPTYTYMNEHRIGSGSEAHWYAHLDLYRAGANLDPHDLGVFDARTFRGYIVEWPEMLADPESLRPTHTLEIEMVQGGMSRSYVFKTQKKPK